jgi:hypothetical protein
MTPVARYRGGHLFSLHRDMNALEKQIASKLGDVSEEDLKKFERFRERVLAFTEYSD